MFRLLYIIKYNNIFICLYWCLFMGLKSLVGVLIFSFVTLSGCNEFEGVVINKTYEPARLWTETKPIIVSDGRRYATGTGSIHYFDDQDWVLNIDCAGVVKELYVSRSTLKGVCVGDMYKKRHGDNEEDHPTGQFLKPGQTLSITGDRINIRR